MTLSSADGSSIAAESTAASASRSCGGTRPSMIGGFSTSCARATPLLLHRPNLQMANAPTAAVRGATLRAIADCSRTRPPIRSSRRHRIGRAWYACWQCSATSSRGEPALSTFRRVRGKRPSGMWTHRHCSGSRTSPPRRSTRCSLEPTLARARARHRAEDRAPQGAHDHQPLLRGSTRTRTSFELAGKRLGADVVNISSSSARAEKGETLLDTAKNLEAMRPDAIVVRHSSVGRAGVPRRARRLRDRQRGRRRARAPDAGAARRVHHPQRKGRLEGLRSRSAATSRTRASRARTRSCSGRRA